MKIKLIALFIMMGSLAAVADNDTYPKIRKQSQWQSQLQ